MNYALACVIVFLIIIIAAIVVVRRRRNRTRQYRKLAARKTRPGIMSRVNVRLAANTALDIVLRDYVEARRQEMQMLNRDDAEEAAHLYRPDYHNIVERLEQEIHTIEPEEWQIWGDILDILVVTHLDEDFADLTQRATTESAIDRLETARNTAEAPAKAAELYFDASIRHTEDTQNVHESKIVKGAAQIYREIRQENPPAISEIEAYVATLPTEKRTAAKRTLDTIRSSDTHLSAIGAGEVMILLNVWGRTLHPANSARRANMQEAVANALADGVEGGNVVCASGRMTRLLYAFTDLDFSPAVAHSSPMSYEAYKNQIFTETSALLNECIASAKTSGDAEMVRVAESYEGKGGDLSAPHEEQFREMFRDRVRANLEKYADRLSDNERNILMTECCAVVDM